MVTFTIDDARTHDVRFEVMWVTPYHSQENYGVSTINVWYINDYVITRPFLGIRLLWILSPWQLCYPLNRYRALFQYKDLLSRYSNTHIYIYTYYIYMFIHQKHHYMENTPGFQPHTFSLFRKGKMNNKGGLKFCRKSLVYWSTDVPQ